ncbi:Fe-S protein assembly chaperone HscA [Nannocystis bainbridge]|uniref:Fe-S protein assembly chaperone HscA n=1 Tax=Nannocystis bainbridge TaxID=2995303 RepID=A0ABT5DRJ9_9BACT|nr:Fe-S protein assembly chaperone HscA [Nannocystis bainbridge]MDC0716275.1 Fe-S protein assembly chaperone HscA [Nannocystis bainbridge]
MTSVSIHDTGALFQIAEPTDSRRAPRRPGRGIGIDLGTTNSLVALAPHGAAPRVLRDSAGSGLVPSVVAYTADPPLVGRAAQALQAEHPSQVLSSVKRLMGRGLADINFAHPYHLSEETPGLLRICVGSPPGSQVGSLPGSQDAPGLSASSRRVTPTEVSAAILRELKLRAEAELGEPCDGAVITVPAYFDDAQRQATRDAGRIAGLQVYRLLAEPTAAALAYGLDRGGEGLFAVYDLGGGTFDVSILRLHKGVFQVLATGGDSALGGDDFDRALAAHLLQKAGSSEPSPNQLDAARLAARAAKERLTEETATRVALPGLPELEVTRAEFDALIEPLAQRTLRACRQALKDAGLRAPELDGVVLVGGSTRVPKVRELVAETFKRPPLADIDPDEVVAWGAAIQADILSGSAREGVTLLDVVPLSLGLETMGGIVEKIIPRNATIPIAARQVFTNYAEHQTGMVIHAVQGERELARDCRSLARFDLKGIPRLPPSMARVEVTFQLDADALLTVSARELMTGVRQSVEVKPTYGLSEEEVDRLVMDSLDHAGDDYARRNAAEARVELGRVVLALRTAVTEVGHLRDLLPDDERVRLEAALAAADAAMADPDAVAEPLNRARTALEKISEPFARRRMERALNAGMAGKSLHDIERALADEEALQEKRAGHSPELLEPEEP